MERRLWTRKRLRKMVKRNVRYLTLEDRKNIEDLLSKGKSVWSIGDMLGIPQTTVYCEVKINGGPEFYNSEISHKNAGKPRKYRLDFEPEITELSFELPKELELFNVEKCLTLEERLQIEYLLKKSWSFRKIALHIKRGNSTISREVRGNGGRLKYDAYKADNARDLRAINRNEKMSQILKENHISPLNNLAKSFTEFKESITQEIESINQTLEIILKHIRNGDDQKN